MQKISGIVIRGKQKGRELGFPSANLKLEKVDKLKSGVYAGETFFDGEKFQSAIFLDIENKILEAHVLDFSGDLYGKKIEVVLGEKIRDILKFESEKDLIEQVQKDLFQIRNTKL